MPKLTAVLFWMLTLTVWAGDATAPSASAPRREFRQSKTYPFIFEPVAYLENGAPGALRFDLSSAECTRRTPPRAPKPTPSPTPLPTPTASPAPEGLVPAPTPAAKATPEPAPAMPADEIYSRAAFPPPENAQPVLQGDALDLTKYPVEVVNIFKNPYHIPKSRKRVFDPVFEPAQPPPPRPEKAPTRRN